MAHFQPKVGDVIVGVDFGTTRTALAYTVAGRSNDIIDVLPPGKAGAFLAGSPKTPTSLLTYGTKIEGFGCHAQEKFAIHGDIDEKWRLFKDFKMALYNPHDPNPDVHAVGDRGSLPLSILLTMSLNYLAEYALQYLKDISVLNSGDAHDVFWVLTLPAIWSDYAKSIMRQSAYKAGMISDENSNKLMLVLEPECAAVASQMWEVGTRFMVADCGGGTLDITCHEVLQSSPLKLKEISIPSGGPFGAKCVDEEFLKFLAKFLGSDRYEELAQDHAVEHFELLLEWERKKLGCIFDPEEDEWTEINLSSILDALDMSSGELAALVTAWNTANPHMEILPVKKKKRKIAMSLDLMKSFFVGPVNSILEAIPVAAVDVEDLKYVVLAGGFGKCSLIRNGAIKAFEGTPIEVICARDPDLCIVKGAVIFGNSTEALIASRRSKYTFGISALAKFCPEKASHAENSSEVYIAPNGDTCLQIFNIHGRVGNDLSSESLCRLQYRPLTRQQKSVHFRILVTEEHNVFLLNEPGISTLCEAEIPLDDMMDLSFEARKVWAQFCFGGSEVLCRFFDHSGEKELKNVNVQFQFF